MIGEFVQLKRRGANYIGCCPFHNEKTPSFNVSPARGIFKCFGCGESGDAVSFLMKHEHYTYPEALRWLAEKYHIDIEEEELTQEQREKNNERDALFHVSEFAQKYFADLLYNDEMGQAVGLSYFHSRGLSDSVIKTFGLGYCLDQWSAFTDHAHKNGYSDNVLEKTGLTIFREDGKYYDRFRGRVMFPIFSVSGRVLGFSGRVLSKEKQAAKYVNSPDSEIYNKSRILYGLYQARSAIAKADKCYLVEGNIDVISMYQSGVENTVASCGTSLTVEQVRLIRRYTKNVTVLYDGDKAGIKAAFRAVNILFEEGFHVRLVLFPDGDDPDSYAQKHGSEELQRYLQENETNFILFKTKVLLEDVKNDPIRKVEVLREMVHTIALVPDIMERTEYVALCASILQMPEQTLQTELAKELARRATEGNKREPESVPAGARVETPSASGDTSVAQMLNDNGLQGIAPSQTVTPQEPREKPIEVSPVMVNPAEYQERKIIRLLVHDGNEMLAIDEPDAEATTENEAGAAAQTPAEPKTHKVSYTVAQIIVGDILNDQLTFVNPLYQLIFNEFATRLQQGETTVDMQLFVEHENPQVRDLAVSLMMDTYHSSETWRSKSIYVPQPEDCIEEDVRESLMAFKMKKLDARIDNLDRQFALTQNDEDRMLLLQEKMDYIRLRQQLGTALNRVIT